MRGIGGDMDYNQIQKGLPTDGMYFTCSIAAAAWAIKVAPEGWFDTQRSICRSASAAGDQTLLLRTWWSPMNIVYDHHIWWLCKIIRSYMITRRGHWELASPNTKQNTKLEPNTEHNIPVPEHQTPNMPKHNADHVQKPNAKYDNEHKRTIDWFWAIAMPSACTMAASRFWHGQCRSLSPLSLSLSVSPYSSLVW